MTYIASDHAGFRLKEKIKQGFKVQDLGPFSYDKKDDYPDYAKKLCKKVLEKKTNKGILICKTGHGMNITANKFKKIYASICWNPSSAKYAKKHENINVLCLPARFIDEKNAKKIINTWLKTKFEGGRHKRRLNKIEK